MCQLRQIKHRINVPHVGKKARYRQASIALMGQSLSVHCFVTALKTRIGTEHAQTASLTTAVPFFLSSWHRSLGTKQAIY